jgi:glycerol kinase
VSEPIILAIDQGTSGTKAIVIQAGRGILAVAETALRPTYGEGGSVEQDPIAMYDSVIETGRAALADAGVAADVVGLANQGETVLAYELGAGNPLTPCIGWQDRRSIEVCTARSASADRIAAVTGLSLDPYFAAPKARWLRENLTTDGVVTTSDAWLVHRLTGEFVTDASTASRTLLLDLNTTQWSDELHELLGLDDEQRPRVVDCAEIVGETSAFGDRAIPVAGLIVDQQAALFAEGCMDPGTAKCTYGTGAFLLANTGSAATRSTHGLATSVAWRLAGAPTYCIDGQAFTVASAVRWLQDLGVINSPIELDSLGGTVRDSGGVTFVPALAGLGAPWWRSDVAGSLSGLRLDTGAAHIVRALIDGIAAQVVELALAAAGDLGAPLSSLRADGGLTQSKLLMQTQADLLQAPVEVYASPHATALGAAAMARLGVNSRLSTAEAIDPWEPAAVYLPRISATEADDRMAAFRAVVAGLVSG